MSKLKEKDGKYYQECEVVMLATKDNTTPLGIDDNSGKLFKFEPKEALWGYQHLYFLSNEKIKEGDWCYNKITKQITQAKTSFYGNFNWVKIIATTDISLGLPQPSKSFIQAFIRAYNESKPITKVLVEIDNEWIDTSGKMAFGIPYQLKVNSNNEVIIKKIKDNYTRDEVCDLLNLYRIYTWENGSTANDLNKWIEENL